MDDDDRASAGMQSEPLGGGGSAERRAVWILASGDEGSTTPGTLPADVVADTVEALQARREAADHDALRGTIDPPAPFAAGSGEPG
jgi:hypothetical protein